MIKTAAFVIIIALRLVYQPYQSSQAQQRNAPFASPKPPSTASSSNLPATIIGISSIKINNTILLKWIIGLNQDAWCFEVEKSTGSSHFTTTALVPGTDRSDTDLYTLYEKENNKEITYSMNWHSKDKKVRQRTGSSNRSNCINERS